MEGAIFHFAELPVKARVIGLRLVRDYYGCLSQKITAVTGSEKGTYER